MDGLTLLNEARAVGLIVTVQGGKLVIRGPREADAVAKRLLAHKSEVVAALEMSSLPDPPPGIAPEDLPVGWREAWDERVAIMVEDGKLPLEHAEAKALADVLLQMKRSGINVPE